jgi:hypothetical protein
MTSPAPHHIYEKAMILPWVRQHLTSPMTRGEVTEAEKSLSKLLKPNWISFKVSS